MNWGDPFSPRTREELEKLRQRPTPALSESKYLSVEEAMDPISCRILRHRQQLQIAEDAARECKSLPSGNPRGDVRSSFAGHAWTRRRNGF